MNDDEIKKALESCSNATAGPFTVEECDCRSDADCYAVMAPRDPDVDGDPVPFAVAHCPIGYDADLLAAARTGWPAALKALQETRAKASRYVRGRAKYVTAYNELASAIRPGSVDPLTDLQAERDAARARLAEAAAELAALRALRDRVLSFIEASLGEPRRASLRPEMLAIVEALNALGFAMPPQAGGA